MAEMSSASQYEAAQRPIGDALDGPAIGGGEEHRDQQHQERRRRYTGDASDAEREERDQRDEGTDHINFAMSEIDHADDAVDHRVADGDEAVDRAEREAVDKLLQQVIHAPPR